MTRRGITLRALAIGAILAVGAGPQAPRESIYWYYDAETALRTAAETKRPVVILKIRADIGPDVKT